MNSIFWISIFGFLSGVFVASVSAPGWYVVLFCILLAAALFLVPRGFFVSIGIIACFFGGLRTESVSLSRDALLDAALGERVVIEGVVFEEPDVRERSTRLSVRTESGAGVLVVAPLHVGIEYGDLVQVEGVVTKPEVFDTGVGRLFNYPEFLAKDGISYQMSFASAEYRGEGEHNFVKAAAISIKQRYLDGLARALPEPHAGLAGGITAGDKRGLGEDLSETFRIVGLVHIVVLSGYNIMVVIGFFERMLEKTRMRTRAIVSITVATFFALITGLASSSVRAAGMAIIATIGKASGRTYMAARALAVVAVLMVLWNPYVLTFDPGFQLSVIATGGLLFISPQLEPLLSFITKRFGLRDIAATTLGTQIAVLPLILFQSGELSVYALPANLFALAAVPWAMLTSGIAAVVGLLVPQLAPVAALPAYVLLSYILIVADFFANLPFASLTIPAFSLVLLGATYAGLICVVTKRRTHVGSANHQG